MRQYVKSLMVAALIAAVSLPAGVSAEKAKKAAQGKKNHTANLPAVLWREPASIASRNLLYGPGGKEHAPRGRFKFLAEDKKGGSPKFEVEDHQGGKWKVKLGEEARPEVAATRLVWAVGYFADEDYYLPELRVEGMPRLSRGQEFVAPDGTVRGARLERKEKGEKKAGHWSWFHNPFAGKKELSGLKVMMALMNNWDLKEENNDIEEVRGVERHYVVADLGATFGKTGNTLSRSKGDLEDYLESQFIKKVTRQEVDFHFHSRPFFLMAVNVPYYHERTKMQQIVKDIPRAHARWIGRLLAQLSSEQLGDAFRAAGYSNSEVRAFTEKVRERIAELNKL